MVANTFLRCYERENKRKSLAIERISIF